MSECVHHWLVGTPSGEEIPAHCQRCEATRSFPNLSLGGGTNPAPLTYDGGKWPLRERGDE